MKRITNLLVLGLFIFNLVACNQKTSMITLKNIGLPKEYVEKYALEAKCSRVYQYAVSDDIKQLEVDLLKIKDAKALSHPFIIDLDSPKGLIIVKGNDLISNECEIIILGDKEQSLSYKYHLSSNDLEGQQLVMGSLLKEISLVPDQKLEIFYQASRNDDKAVTIDMNYFKDSNDINSAAQQSLSNQENYLITIMFKE